VDVIRVGNFELRPSERMLCSAGKPVELGARAFDLLLVLVEHHGRLVTKATLLDRVWPRLVVDENNLPAQVASLRRVLGAGAIRTVPGFGYRLELEVSSGSAEEPAHPPSAAPREPEPPRLSVPRRAWPNRLGSLVGRDGEVCELLAAMDRSCLVTIVGIAGVGKTRIAQEILVRKAERPDVAVAWVSLHPITQAEHVASAIAIALGLSLPAGVDGFAALRQALEQVPVLLILDGAEKFGDSLATPLAALIWQTQGLRALVTSQVPLGIAGETVYRLPVLPVPGCGTPEAETARYAAVELFTQRAAAADRRFELTSANAAIVAEICRRLDGNPLALELAAARVPALGVAVVLERLDDRFRLLRHPGHTPDPRHGALQTAFEWSYGLLAPSEQRVFNRLGVFAGSFALHAAARCVADETIDTAEAIDLIGRLVDRSLVTVLPVDPPRYALLETARYFAVGRLSALNELAAAQERMAATMLNLLDSAYQEYWSLDEAIWLHRYAPELNNVRAAIEWAGAHDRDLGIALYGSAWPLFVETDLYAEGRDRFAQAATQLSDALPTARVGRFWEAVATYDSGRQCDRARYAAELASKMHRASSDGRADYYALMLLALNWRGDDAAAQTAFDEARRLEDPAWAARLLAHGALTEGALLMSSGKLIEARSAYRRAVRLALTMSERLALAATVNIVELDIACGDAGSALQLGRPLALSLRHSGHRETRFELLAMTFSALLIAGDIAEARATGSELYDLALRLDTGKLYSVLDAMALLTCIDRRYDAAARIAAFSDDAHDAHGQAHRRPAEAQMQSRVTQILDECLGPAWRERSIDPRERLDEAAACSLALGLRA
jgi:predicted ATPase/DNA-binding winged helix-turn-helix (wHTH) protein